MRSNKFNFQRQQEYSRDLAFLPMQDMKKYKGFIYKVYSSAGDNMKKVFDHPLNQEAFDKHYADAIIQEVNSKGLPSVTNAINRLSASLHALEKLERIPSLDKKILKSHLDAIHQIQLMLVLYKKDLLKPLVIALKQFQKNKGDSSSSMLCTDHLQLLLQLMDRPGKELSMLTDLIGELLPGQPMAMSHALLIAQASEEISCTKYLIQKFQQVNSDLVYLILQWKNTRSTHEQQQVLN
jgi:hypothetical protein